MLLNYVRELDITQEVVRGDTLCIEFKAIKFVGVKGWLITKPLDNANFKPYYWENEGNCRCATIPVFKETEKAYALIMMIGVNSNADPKYGLVWAPKSQCFDASDLEELQKANAAIDRDIAYERRVFERMGK